MRVARRVRPSHVGCGATVSRRRLYAASVSDTDLDTTPPDDTPESPSTFWSLVIHADGTIASPEGPFSFLTPAESAVYEPSPALAGASARGR